jgi:hypothetical protein
MTHETHLLMCPCCKTYMDKAKNAEQGYDCAPKNGDFSICANCAEILCFVITEENVSYRKATQSDLDKADTETLKTLTVARDFILLGNHGFSNMTKEEIDLRNFKENW